MTALPSLNIIRQTDSPQSFGPMHRLFSQARIAELPGSAHNLKYDTDTQPGGTKTLLTFAADRADVMLFVAMSPALRKTEAERYSTDYRLEVGASDSHAKVTGGPDSCRRIPDEPDFPWWRPELFGNGRRFAYDTPDYDFIEVIINDDRGEVFIRAIK